MSGIITLERAYVHLKAWYDAELAVSTGQSYSFNGKSLTRADLADIRKQIVYWEDKVNRLRGKKKRKAMRYVPRDL